MLFKDMTYIENKKLRNVIIRVATEHSSMFYFIMESNDNVAFYSTLPFAKNSLYRDITIYCTPELSHTMDQIIEHFQKKYSVEIIQDQIILDQEL